MKFNEIGSEIWLPGKMFLGYRFGDRVKNYPELRRIHQAFPSLDDSQLFSNETGTIRVQVNSGVVESIDCHHYDVALPQSLIGKTESAVLDELGSCPHSYEMLDTEVGEYKIISFDRIGVEVALLNGVVEHLTVMEIFEER